MYNSTNNQALPTTPRSLDDHCSINVAKKQRLEIRTETPRIHQPPDTRNKRNSQKLVTIVTQAQLEQTYPLLSSSTLPKADTFSL
jgi:hypothetical protein